ncbi:hypothetical protein JYK02_14325 [Corallococcus macrosporus]|uniref:Uncharacterized protein n=1 Tax=Corallococcus macrosporus TaxID=35 RepID=A0ABS3DCX3_9BACT|nr:hypothetical protein [Corallococcus macrosporus]MBN8228686.1 hypothetical protein [Corallococcus macrosporus]
MRGAATDTRSSAPARVNHNTARASFREANRSASRHAPSRLESMDGPVSTSSTTGRSLLCPRTRSSNARSSADVTRATARHGPAAHAEPPSASHKASPTTRCHATTSNTDMQ